MSRVSEEGFSLLEVILTIVILLSLTIAATNAITTSIDIRKGLSDRVRVTHELQGVFSRVVSDVTHIFIFDTRRQEYNPTVRATKTLFQKERDRRIAFTTMNHKPLNANSPESDQTFVVYELRANKDNSAFQDLYRGASKVIPQDFKDDIPMQHIASRVKRFDVIPWTGEKWDEGNWDTNRSDHRNMLPRMIKIILEVYEIAEEQEFVSESQRPTSLLSTVVYLPRSLGLKEYKPYSGSLKWD